MLEKQSGAWIFWIIDEWSPWSVYILQNCSTACTQCSTRTIQISINSFYVIWNQGYNARKVSCIILCVHIETSSLWAELVNNNNNNNFDNSHNSFLWPEYFIDFFYVKDGSHIRLWHPSCVYITAQRQYTAVQKMRTPLK